jgi:hypothetical protein
VVNLIKESGSYRESEKRKREMGRGGGGEGGREGGMSERE